jgi:hypothetical protein
MGRHDLVGKQMKGFLFDVSINFSLTPEHTQKDLEGRIGLIVDYDHIDDSVEVDFGEDRVEWYPASEAINHLVVEEECNSIFKIGDKVFHIEYGWGEVIGDDYEDEYYPIDVQFDKFTSSFTKDGKEDEEVYTPLLSFTEYTLQGFSQERPIVLPEPGELCLVRDKNYDNWLCREFKEYNPNAAYPFVTKGNNTFKKNETN